MHTSTITTMKTETPISTIMTGDRPTSDDLAPVIVKTGSGTTESAFNQFLLNKYDGITAILNKLKSNSRKSLK